MSHSVGFITTEVRAGVGFLRALNSAKKFLCFNTMSLQFYLAVSRRFYPRCQGDIFLDISRRNKNPFLSSPFPSQENKRNKNYAFEDGASGNE